MGKGLWVGAAIVLLATGSSTVSVALPTPGYKGAGDDYSPDQLYVGDRVLLIGDGGQRVPCAATDGAWAQLIRIQRGVGPDKGKLAALQESGEVYEVTAGTEAIVLEPSHLAPGLKLADGDRAGRVCFTDRLFVKRYRPNQRGYWRH